MNSSYSNHSSSAAAVPMNSAPNMAFLMQQQPQYLNHKVVLSETNNSSSSSSCGSTSSGATFPMKLHAMLTDSATHGFDDVVCWLPGGQAFKVLDPHRFSDSIMPQYFNQTKYKSFQRQLNIYGFQRVHHGPHKGGYTHKCFVQGYPDLCEQIKRKGSGSVAHEVMPILKQVYEPVKLQRPVQPQQQQHQAQQPLIDPIQPFAWDVEAEAALGDESSDDLFENTVDEIAAFASRMTPNAQETAAVDPTPLPFQVAPQPYPQPQLQQQQQQEQQQLQPHLYKQGLFAQTGKSTVLNSDDISFFKNLFQPGDSHQEKEILDSFFIPSQKRQPQRRPVLQQQQQFFQSAPLQQYQATPAPMPAAPVAAPQESATTTAAPLLTTAAVSEYNFPRKLYRLLQDCESNPEYKSIVSWGADGKSFKVHCKKRFVSTILPNYFDQTQYASFRRQLNMYSFLRQSMSTYANPYFMRGHKELLDNVVRKNGNGGTATKKKKD